jgi:hypothetical protein
MQKFWIEQTDDETVEMFVGERSVGSFNHDEHGWSGIGEAEKLFENVAKALGANFEKRHT